MGMHAKTAQSSIASLHELSAQRVTARCAYAAAHCAAGGALPTSTEGAEAAEEEADDEGPPAEPVAPSGDSPAAAEAAADVSSIARVQSSAAAACAPSIRFACARDVHAATLVGSRERARRVAVTTCPLRKRGERTGVCHVIVRETGRTNLAREHGVAVVDDVGPPREPRARARAVEVRGDARRVDRDRARAVALDRLKVAQPTVRRRARRERLAAVRRR